jgi:hypothetical protein
MSEQDIGRRQLLLSSAVGALALTPSRTAHADTTFSNFRFPATGAPTARTMPDRLDDVTNVKDWGATGDGKTDDTVAIQAAINHGATRNYREGSGATLFFPPGKYSVSQPLLFQWPGSPRLIGGGKETAIINANFQGYVISAPGTPPNLSVRNIVSSTGSAGGLIRLTLAVNSITGGDILPNITYNISGVTGTVAGAVNGNQKFINVVYTTTSTQVDIVGSRFPSGVTYTGGGTVTGPGTQAGTIRIEGLRIENYSATQNSGCVKVGYDYLGGSINNCHFSGFIGVDCASNVGGGGVFAFGIYDCYFGGAGTAGLADASNTGGAYRGYPPGSVGCYMGQGVISNCRIQGFDIGIAMSTNGSVCVGCSCEISNIGISAGLRDDQENIIKGFSILGFQTEAVRVGIQIINSSGGLISGNVLTAPTISSVPDAMGTLHWNSVNNTVTVTTDNPHNLGNPGTVFGLNIGRVPRGFNPGPGIFPGANTKGTIEDATHFHYSLSTNPGPDAHLPWSLSPIAAIQVSGPCSYTTFTANNLTQFSSPFSSVDLSGVSDSANNIFEGCDAAAGITYPPSNNKAGWKFRQVGTIWVGDPEVAMAMKFADLPNGKMPGTAGTNTQQGPWEGQEYTIVDCPTNPFPATGTAFGAVVSSGTTTSPFHAKLRYCGSPLAWRIVG